MEKHKSWFHKHPVLTTIIAIFLIGMVYGLLKGDSSTSSTNFDDNNDNNLITNDNTYNIEITGTNGLEFTGSIGGGGNTRSIEGNVPASYNVDGWPAVAVIQKRGNSGTLVVTINKENRILNTQTTTAEYGVVTVSSG